MKISIDGYEWVNEEFVWSLDCKKETSIVLSVPHDTLFRGDLAGLFDERKSGVFGRDLMVWPIVKDIMLQVPVNVVRGLVPRNLIDYNRSDNCEGALVKSEDAAYTDPRLKKSYDTYHKSIEVFLQKTIKRLGKSNTVLFDMHGFSKQPEYGDYDIILGTDNRRTLVSDIDKQFFEFFSERDYRVFLPKEESFVMGQGDRYLGNFTTLYYSKLFQINVMQVEISKWFRSREGEGDGRRLANDLAEFLQVLKS